MTPLVFIPGMMCDARLFLPQITAFQHTPIFIASITQHDNVEDLAHEILLYAPAHFSLCGLSMGGIIAMEMIRQAPERIKRLCLMDTNPLAETDEMKALRQPQIDKVKNGNLEQVMQQQFIPKYFEDKKPPQKLAKLCIDMALNLGDEAFIHQSRALKNRPDQTKTLQNFKKPTLILHGEHDTLCPAERHQLMHQLMPHSRYAIIKNAGHLSTLENPQQVNQELHNWQA
jgi:pimeloyl-ACP methyl ester carboxylesterase